MEPDFKTILTGNTIVLVEVEDGNVVLYFADGSSLMFKSEGSDYMDSIYPHRLRPNGWFQVQTKTNQLKEN